MIIILFPDGRELTYRQANFVSYDAAGNITVKEKSCREGEDDTFYCYIQASAAATVFLNGEPDHHRSPAANDGDWLLRWINDTDRQKATPASVLARLKALLRAFDARSMRWTP